MWFCVASPNSVQIAESESEDDWGEPEEVTTIEGVQVRAKKGDFQLVRVDKSGKGIPIPGKKPNARYIGSLQRHD